MSLASGSCLTHSRNIIPQLRATSGFSYLQEREGGEGGRGGREERKREEKVISLSCSFLGSWDHLPSDEDEEDLALSAHVLHSRRPCSNLPPKDVGEDLGHVLLGLR